ncbi:MAG TPA: GGDEF domain-containing protein, partial [Gammaproteobacteria bacterium]|nr:GGDEF domain-containing protein [Gammaproteobacteria bacterium]
MARQPVPARTGGAVHPGDRCLPGRHPGRAEHRSGRRGDRPAPYPAPAPQGHAFAGCSEKTLCGIRCPGSEGCSEGTGWSGSGHPQYPRSGQLRYRSRGLLPVTLGIDRNTTFARLQERLESREGRGLSLFLIHVSRLRQLNRSLGYRAVDEFLNELEERLMRVARDPERVERIGNADYLVTLDGLMNRGHAQLAALKMLDELSKPLQRENRLCHLDAAIGIWMAVDGSTGDTETVLQQLEWAITEAHQTPEKYALWDGEKDESE